MSKLETANEITKVRSELQKALDLICPFFFELIHIEKDQKWGDRIYDHLELAKQSAERASSLLGEQG